MSLPLICDQLNKLVKGQCDFQTSRTQSNDFERQENSFPLDMECDTLWVSWLRINSTDDLSWSIVVLSIWAGNLWISAWMKCHLRLFSFYTSKIVFLSDYTHWQHTHPLMVLIWEAKMSMTILVCVWLNSGDVLRKQNLLCPMFVFFFQVEQGLCLTHEEFIVYQCIIRTDMCTYIYTDTSHIQRTVTS